MRQILTEKANMAEQNLQNRFDEDQNDENAMDGKFLTFYIADEDYGIAIRHVTEIIGIQKINEVPDMPDFVKGVINLRGRIIPVIDVRTRFLLPAREYDDRTCIIVVNIDENTIGLVVDKVNEVADIPDSNIEPPPSGRRKGNNYIFGIGKIENEVKILLDVTKLLYETDVENIGDKTSDDSGE
jgi:purine-binding chemotaxis protein CheW